ncbi:hypothetical protein V2A60_008543 [Cordyceps javanica]
MQAALENNSVDSVNELFRGMSLEEGAKLLGRMYEANCLEFKAIADTTEKKDPKVSSTAVAVGWGAQREHVRFERVIGVDKLSKIAIPVHPRQTCVDYEPETIGSRDTIMCAGGDGKNTCGQDSGGPLFDEETGELIGVTSFALPDRNDKYCSQAPAIYTRVASYMDFINANLGGAGGLPDPDYAWTRRAVRPLERLCRSYQNSGNRAKCPALVQPCVAETKPDADADMAEAGQALTECARWRMACGDAEGPERSQCIDKVNECLKDENSEKCYAPLGGDRWDGGDD